MRAFLLVPLFSAGFSYAATIDFTFRALTAEVSVNGGPAVKTDLAVKLLADTSKLVSGGGYGNSDRYLDLKGFVSSQTLGLLNVEATTPLTVDIGAPAATRPFRDATVLMVSNNVVNGIFDLRDVGRWDRTSDIGPLRGPATASGPLKIALKNGSTLSITTLESVEPWGKASFQAVVMPDTKAFEGNLRKLGEKELVLESPDKRALRLRLIAKTMFRDPQGSPIRDSLLRPGDRLSVTVNKDDPETAVAVVLVEKRAR